MWTGEISVVEGKPNRMGRGVICAATPAVDGFPVVMSEYYLTGALRSTGIGHDAVGALDRVGSLHKFLGAFTGQSVPVFLVTD